MGVGAKIKFIIPGLIEFHGEYLNEEQANRVLGIMQRQIGDDLENDSLIEDLVKEVSGVLTAEAPLSETAVAGHGPIMESDNVIQDGTFGYAIGDAVGDRMLALYKQISNISDEPMLPRNMSINNGPMLSPEEHFTDDPSIRIKTIDGERVRCYQIHYVCKMCGHRGRRFRPAGTQAVGCHKCFTLLKVKPSTARGVGEGESFKDFYGNYYVARELMNPPAL